MIEAMKYVNLAGHTHDIDRIIDTYICQYEIQLEYAQKELQDIEGVSALTAPNPYTALFAESKNFSNTAANYLGVPPAISDDEARRVITEASAFLETQKVEINRLTEEKNALADIIDNVSHFSNMDFDIADIAAFSHIGYRFGRLPIAGYKQFESYLSETSQIILLKADDDGESVWCVYFAPNNYIEKADITFASLHFHRIIFRKEIDGELPAGPPAVVLSKMTKKLEEIEREIHKLEMGTLEQVGISEGKMAAAYARAAELFYRYDCRKFACKTDSDYVMFVGWMPKEEALRMSRDAEGDPAVVCVLLNENEATQSKPPTKLKNNVFVRPFEFLVRMYGVPTYGEIDPTPFIAVTYSVFFGMMYGDVGQGAVLSIVGLFLSKFKHLKLGAILFVVGFFSMFFGFMYGSVFGYEKLIEPVWLAPMEPDKIMILLATAIGIGALMVIVCMIYSMINQIKNKNIGELLFSHNGLAGIVLYISAVSFGLMALGTDISVPLPIYFICLLIPVILITFKTVFAGLIDKSKKRDKSESVGIYAFTSVMELVEVILGFFTNTLSFVRIAGYAISHAGLMFVVMELSGANSGNPNLPAIIFGNIFVMGLEGLIVFIQAMRLQYYEMFSRYYEGGGNEFVAYKNLI